MALPTASRSSARPLGMSLRAVMGFIGMSAVAGVLITVGVTPALALTGLATSNTIGLFQNLPGYLDVGQLMQRTNIYAGDGTTLLASVYDQNRVEVGWDDIAQTAKDAAVAGEDPRFYEHGGIDLQGTLRAVAITLTGDDLQGGSSITQQYVKNVLVQKAESITDEAARDKAYAEATAPTPERKLKEMRLAIGLEKEHSKDDILLGYLNIALFGGTVYGIEAAANYYYGIPASQLSISQAASLLAIVNNPEKFRFDLPENEENGAANGYAATKDRRDYILSEELKYGKISQEQYDAAVAEPITPNITQPSTGCATAGNAAYFCDYVLNVLRNDTVFGESDDERYAKIRRGGYDVVTTLDLDIQQVSQASLNAYIPPTDPRFEIGATAASVEARTGRVLSMVQNTTYSQDPEVLAATPGTSAVNLNVDEAMSGSRGVQPGSTYKVFTLANWLTAGRTLNETFPSPTSGFRSYPKKCNVDGVVGVGSWAPKNDSPSDNRESMSAVTATQGSINTGFMGMAHQLDLCDIRTTAEAFGVHTATNTEMFATPATVLGTNTVAPLSIAGAYAGIANDGTACKPIVIDRITDATGAGVAIPSASCAPAVSPEVAHGMQYAMQRVITSGTAYASDPDDGIEHIAKTGTTDDAADVWTAGASRSASLAVWVGSINGFADSTKMNLRNVRITGTSGTPVQAAQTRHAIFKPIMTALDQKYGGEDFEDPTDAMLGYSSRAAATTEVPDVTGLSVEAASARLQAAGLSAGHQEIVDSSTVPAGSIVSTTPSAGLDAVDGAVIPLQISSGKAPVNPDDTGDINGDLLPE